jgi:thiol-disulfide isomerase/thioredoxin
MLNIKHLFTNGVTRISLALLFLVMFNLHMFAQPNQVPNNAHQTYAKAKSRLYSLNSFLPSDSILINAENNRISSLYKNTADSLLENNNTTAYALFAYKRYTQLASSAQNLFQLRQYHDSLIHIIASYPVVLQTDSIANVIAKSIVHNFELGTITHDSVLLFEVVHIINKHINSVYGKGASIYKQQKIVTRYAKQYYNRGMFSMAEHVFTSFKHLYNKQNMPSVNHMQFASNYHVYDKNGITKQTINEPSPIKIIAFNQDTTDYNLVYLINIIRASLKKYPDVQFIIARNPKLLNDAYIKAIGRNIAGNVHYINLSTVDINYYKPTTSFVVLKANNQIAYSTGNPVDFLEWLKYPSQKQKVVTNQAPKTTKNDAHIPPIPDTLLKYKKTFGNMQLQLKGNWSNNVSAVLQTYRFTNEVVGDTSPNTGSYTIGIYDKNNLIYRQLVIELNKNHKAEVVTMLANANYNISTSFTVSGLNNKFIELENKLIHQRDTIEVYNTIIDEYPYTTSNFIDEIKARRDIRQAKLKEMLSGNEDNPQLYTFLNANQILFNLQQSKVKQKITYNDFVSLMPVEQVDTILYRSPYYKQIIDAWLQFGSNNPISSVDLLFSSKIMMPQEATSMVGKYIWKYFNAISREDIMMHIDTMYLATCTADNINIKQRLDGYKRMAVGKKAPDITWYEDGEEKHLYKLEADTVFVVFWADWCAHCKETLPPLYRRTISDNSNIEVIAINIDEDESSQQLGIRLMPEWHHVRASGKWDDAIIEQWNIFGTPTIYMLNNNMIILKKD